MAESEEELKNLLMRVKEESETAGLMLCFHDCSHEIRRHLILGRNGMRNSILKSKDITWPIKVCIDKAMVLPLIMYRYES